jgi:hypothetical protein
MATDITIYRPGRNRERRSYTMTLIASSVRGRAELRRHFVLLGSDVAFCSTLTMRQMDELLGILIRQWFDEGLMVEVY